MVHTTDNQSREPVAARRAPTLRDVAAAARVDKTTVSVVLNGNKSGTRVSDATRRRIEAAAVELGYQPNAIARSLRTQRTGVIGFYSGHEFVNAHDLYLSEIISGLQDSCNAFRYDLLLHSAFRVHSTEALYAELANGKVDGLLLFASGDDALVNLLAASTMPAVAITDSVPNLPSVVVDDAEGGRLAARHLAAKGHRRVLYSTAGPLSRAYISVVRRLEAFRETAAALGMTVLEAPAVDGNARLSDEQRALLTAPPGERPTAAVCWTDGAAHRIMKESRALGLRVPDDLAVIGYNGITTEFEPSYTLTTIRAPWSDVARTAVGQVVDRLRGKPIPGETVLPVTLVEGDTT
jgi:DNA-binding LacI/PurR family transcriptional regulator